jgi:murein DD-endopeptidase MepM/ murein hydrolase activator NlpD
MAVKAFITFTPASDCRQAAADLQRLTYATSSRRSFLLLVIFMMGMVGCVRPDKGPSPFAGFQHATQASEAISGPQTGPDFEIIPNSELVYGPTLKDFSIADFADSHFPELNAYHEEVDERNLSGTQILEKVCRDYSVNPRLLLALLRNRSGDTLNLENPFLSDTAHYGLFRQLSWAANELNRGYYTSRISALHQLTLIDGTVVNIPDQVVAGTAAVQYLFSLLLGYNDWKTAVGPLGLFADYAVLFGSPRNYAIEPLIPGDLTQPEMQLPYTESEGWYFTSGPHSAWGDGAAWAALDFAPVMPSDDVWGCYESSAWVRAVADGQIVRVSDGLLVEDLDGDGFEGSGWTVLYMHVAEKGRIGLGTQVKAGDALGHPSCEGGPADGTHLHIARRYNGEWISADLDMPFFLSGWASHGFGVEYDGILAKGGSEIHASGFPTDENRVY